MRIPKLPKEVYTVGELTHREHEILALLSEGLQSKEIAFRFKVSVKTISSHHMNIWKKLKITNDVQLGLLLALYMVEHGWK